MIDRSDRLGLQLGQLLLIALLWGTAFPAIAVALEAFSPVTVAAARIGLGALCLGALVGRPTLGGDARGLGLLLVVGVVGHALPFTLIARAEVDLGAGTVAVLLGGAPLLGLLVSHWMSTDDRIAPLKLLGLALGAAGAALVGQAQLSPRGGAPLAVGAVVLSALAYAVSGNLYRRLAPETARRGTPLALGFGFLALVPFLVLQGGGPGLEPGLRHLGALLYLGIFPTAIAYHLRYRLVAEAGYTFASFTGYLVPVFGALLAWAILGEVPGTALWLALLLVVAGLGIGVAHRLLPREGRVA